MILQLIHSQAVIFFSVKVFSLTIIPTSLLLCVGPIQGDLWAGLGSEEMLFDAREGELPPMDLPPVNYEEFLHEPYFLEPILEPRFPVESAPFEPSQPEQTQAESRTSLLAFTKPPAGMSFTTLMGLEDSRGSSDFAIKTLLEALKVVVDVASIG